MEGKNIIRDLFDKNDRNAAGESHFHVFRIEDFDPVSLPYQRRDFYKVTLVTRGEGILSYANRVIMVKDDVTVFTNPMIPYGYETFLANEQGYFCLFNEAFVNNHLKADSLSASPLFAVNGNHVLMNDQKMKELLSGIFENMLKEYHSDYVHKFELLRSYLQIILHESLKIGPPEDLYKSVTTNSRITNLFLKLLERQFPVDSALGAIMFKNVNEFASQLAVHPDHLNRAVKDVTGKTTRETIIDRIVMEAKSMLVENKEDIAGIAYLLGFQHASNFITFFKKQTGQTPNHFRRSQVVIS